MQYDIHFPVLLRARPKGSRNIQNVHADQVVQVRVAEVSSSEAVTAFVHSVPNEGFSLKEHAGRLYRKAVVAGFSLQEVLGSPFDAQHVDRRTSSVVGHGRLAYPVSGSMWKQQSWWLSFCVLDNLGERETWPPHQFGNWRRSSVDFDLVRQDLSQINPGDYSVQQSMQAEMERRLLVIGGELHVETDSLVYRVGLVHTNRGKPAIGVKLSLAPDCVDRDLAHRYFPLASKLEAIECAERMRAEEPDYYRNMDTLIDGEEVDVNLQERFDFDNCEEQIDRITMAMANGVRKFLHRNSGKIEKLTEDEAALAMSVFDDLAKTNYILGVRPSASQYASELLPIWEKLGKPLYGYVENILNLDRQKLHRFMIDRLNDRAIDIGAVVRPPVLTP
ncbi:hypothetical protein GOB57_21900 [Sinorhizobium meliloti]|nr:hypothetical protein [Sinorhizobium meliloti]